VRHQSMRLSTGARAGSWTASRCATSDGSASGSCSAVRSTSHAPSGKRSSESAARRTASLVLPIPPAPVSVSKRVVGKSCSSWLRSWARPTNALSSVGRLCCRRGRGGAAASVGAGARGVARTSAAAATRALRCWGGSARASARRRTVAARGAPRRPRSRAAMALALSCARSASASCERLAVSRNSRSSAPKESESGNASPGWPHDSTSFHHVRPL
jgi:hypothetical protein